MILSSALLLYLMFFWCFSSSNLIPSLLTSELSSTWSLFLDIWWYCISNRFPTDGRRLSRIHFSPGSTMLHAFFLINNTSPSRSVIVLISISTIIEILISSWFPVQTIFSWNVTGKLFHFLLVDEIPYFQTPICFYHPLVCKASHQLEIFIVCQIIFIVCYVLRTPRI